MDKLQARSRLRTLFTDDIWSLDTSEPGTAYLHVARFIKLVRITVSTFMENRMGFQCVALSYFVTLAVVPFCAFIFAITGGLKISDKLSPVVSDLLSEYPDLAQFILEKANNIIDIAKGGGVGVISAVFFLWTILWMMFQVERVFNNVWNIRKIPRNIFKRFGFYFLVLWLSPFLMILFGTGIAYRSNITNLFGLDISDIKFLTKMLGDLVFYVLTVLTLSVMYKFIPATKVRYVYALKSAVFAGIVFMIFQYIYLQTQMFVGRLSAVYGVLAAVPLFLIWLNFSWQIIMYGAELTYSYQNVDTYSIAEWDKESKS